MQGRSGLTGVEERESSAVLYSPMTDQEQPRQDGERARAVAVGSNRCRSAARGRRLVCFRLRSLGNIALPGNEIRVRPFQLGQLLPAMSCTAASMFVWQRSKALAHGQRRNDLRHPSHLWPPFGLRVAPIASGR
jgi:hypothetical protein